MKTERAKGTESKKASARMLTSGKVVAVSAAVVTSVAKKLMMEVVMMLAAAAATLWRSRCEERVGYAFMYELESI